MSTVKLVYPNWAQAILARSVGLDPEGVTVRMEDDLRIVFLEHKTRKDHCVDKRTGKVIVM